jgi:transcriptional antiterminator RfaH
MDVLTTEVEGRNTMRTPQPSENGEAMFKDFDHSNRATVLSSQPDSHRTGLKSWYAVYTTPRHEKKVAQNFAQSAIESFLPLYKSRRYWKDRSKSVIELPLFPSYMFVHIAFDDRYAVLSIPGVLSFVNAGGKPAALDDGEIEALRSGMARGLVEPHEFLKVGEQVRIMSGPFVGMQGVLESSNSNFRVILTLEQIKKSIAVQVDASHLEKVEGVVNYSTQRHRGSSAACLR